MTGPRPGLAAALPVLACPTCGARDLDEGLAVVEPGVVGCRRGHRFDVSRRGYLTLLGPRARTDTADSAAMIDARAAFLAAGHFAPIAAAVAAAVVAAPEGLPVLDVGAGTGWYLAAALAAAGGPIGSGAPAPIGIALDSSRAAARRVVTAHPEIGAVVADAWSRWPVRSAAIGTVLSVFAPRSPAEIHRVLRPGGRLVAVTPRPGHLAELRPVVGLLDVDPGKPERLEGAVAGLLTPVARRGVRVEAELSRADVLAVGRMGPSAHHSDAAEIGAAVARLDTVTRATVDVVVTVLDRPA